jgi:hypothetical protein
MLELALPRRRYCRQIRLNRRTPAGLIKKVKHFVHTVNSFLRNDNLIVAENDRLIKDLCIRIRLPHCFFEMSTYANVLQSLPCGIAPEK